MLIYECVCGAFYRTDTPTIDRECSECKKDSKLLVKKKLFFIKTCVVKKCQTKIYRENKNSQVQYCDSCAYKRHLKQSNQQRDKLKEKGIILDRYKYNYVTTLPFNTRRSYKKKAKTFK